MKKYENGQYVEMTAEEISEIEKMRAEVEAIPQIATEADYQSALAEMGVDLNG